MTSGQIVGKVYTQKLLNVPLYFLSLKRKVVNLRAAAENGLFAGHDEVSARAVADRHLKSLEKPWREALSNPHD